MIALINSIGDGGNDRRDANGSLFSNMFISVFMQVSLEKIIGYILYVIKYLSYMDFGKGR